MSVRGGGGGVSVQVWVRKEVQEGGGGVEEGEGI